MNQNETQWDRFLKIRTSGRDDSHADQYRYPYEPTAYVVLERLANSGLIRKNNTLLDYGTGKGRVCFYLSYQTRCKTIGIEYDERIYQGATENKETGYRCDHLEYLMSVNTTIAFCDEALDIFLARDLKKTHQHLDPDEEIEVEAWELSDLLKRIYAGELTDGKTVSAILAYACKAGQK